jgi:glycosyltransferase involved in cell wall biosynthesis
MIREGGLVHGMLCGVARFGFGGKRSVAVLGLGPDMAEKLGAYGAAGRKVDWVALWETAGRTAGEGEMEALRKARGWGDGETVFLYSGNMGLGHCFGDVIAAGRRLRGEGVRLAFFGRGGRRREVEAAVREGEWGDAVPAMGDYVAQEELPAHLASGDVHLASLDPRWDGTMVPSKLQGIFFSGRPVLFTGSATSSIGRWIQESGAGWVCAPGDEEAHVAAMREARDPGVRARMGAAARAYAERHFNRAINVPRVAGILTGGVESRAGRAEG